MEHRGALRPVPRAARALLPPGRGGVRRGDQRRLHRVLRDRPRAPAFGLLQADPVQPLFLQHDLLYGLRPVSDSGADFADRAHREADPLSRDLRSQGDPAPDPRFGQDLCAAVLALPPRLLDCAVRVQYLADPPRGEALCQHTGDHPLLPADGRPPVHLPV